MNHINKARIQPDLFENAAETPFFTPLKNPR